MLEFVNKKSLIFLALLVTCGFLVSKYPEEVVIIVGICAIIVIGTWLYQAYQEKRV